MLCPFLPELLCDVTLRLLAFSLSVLTGTPLSRFLRVAGVSSFQSFLYSFTSTFVSLHGSLGSFHRSSVSFVVLPLAISGIFCSPVLFRFLSRPLVVLFPVCVVCAFASPPVRRFLLARSASRCLRGLLASACFSFLPLLHGFFLSFGHPLSVILVGSISRLRPRFPRRLCFLARCLALVLFAASTFLHHVPFAFTHPHLGSSPPTHLSFSSHVASTLSFRGRSGSCRQIFSFPVSLCFGACPSLLCSPGPSFPSRPLCVSALPASLVVIPVFLPLFFLALDSAAPPPRPLCPGLRPPVTFVLPLFFPLAPSSPPVLLPVHLQPLHLSFRFHVFLLLLFSLFPCPRFSADAPVSLTPPLFFLGSCLLLLRSALILPPLSTSLGRVAFPLFSFSSASLSSILSLRAATSLVSSRFF